MGIPTINKVTAINGIMMFRIPFVGFFMSMRNYQVTNHNCSDCFSLVTNLKINSTKMYNCLMFLEYMSGNALLEFLLTLKPTKVQKSVILQDQKEIVEVIQTFFETGKTKDFSVLGNIQLNSPEFSSFSDVPPYGLKGYSESIALEELRFSSISDYDYEIKNAKINVFGTTGIVTFELTQKGILVDNKAFTGQHITINGRATFVLIKKDTWKILHYHLDKISN